MTKNLTCHECDGKCCKYIVIEIDIPETEKDFDDIKWYVCHENTFVFIDEDGTWNLEFATPCKYINEKNLCEVYENRPNICRDYSQEVCPFHNKYKELQRFSNVKEVEEYIEKIFKKGLHTCKKEDQC